MTETVEGKKWGMGGGTLNEPLHRPQHKCSTKNSQILAVHKVTTWARTYGIDCWIPTKLVVVNLVKLHLTKFSAAASHLTSYNM